MKYLFSVLVICFFLPGCTDNKTGDKTNQAFNDTFPSCEENQIEELPDGFILDTIKKPESKCDYCETLIVPIMINKSNKHIEAILLKEILRKKDIELLTDISGADTATLEKVSGKTYTDIAPLTIGMNKNLVSYGFINMLMDEGAMRPFRRYFTINYDTTQKRFIYLSDFFSIKDSADSAFLKRIVYGDYENLNLSFYNLDDDIVFSADKENVYFYFDMFGFAGNPHGIVRGVRKKYINKFIREQYR